MDEKLRVSLRTTCDASGRKNEMVEPFDMIKIKDRPNASVHDIRIMHRRCYFRKRLNTAPRNPIPSLTSPPAIYVPISLPLLPR